MSRLIASAALAAILGACAATAPTVLSAAPAHAAAPHTSSKAHGVSCSIRVVRTANGQRLEPVVESARALSGEYEFKMSTGGGAGSSEVVQGGPFSVRAGERLTLSASEINAGGRVRATLVIRDAHAELCRSDYRA